MCKNAIHICRRCRKEVCCDLPGWICPWVNDDEDDMCDSCLELTKAEMEFWEKTEIIVLDP